MLLIKVRAEYDASKAASGLEVVLPMPRSVLRVSCMYDSEPKPAGSQSWDWQEKQRRLVWKFKKVPGATEYTLRVRCQTLCCYALALKERLCIRPPTVVAPEQRPGVYPVSSDVYEGGDARIWRS